MPRADAIEFIQFDGLQFGRLCKALDGCEKTIQQMTPYERSMYQSMQSRVDDAQELGVDPQITQKQFTYLNQLGSKY